MLYQIHCGTVSVSGKVLFDRVEFEVRGRDRVAVVGENGSGKSTLLKVIAGERELDRDDHMDQGVITTDRSLTIGYLSQDAFDDKEITVDEELRKACPDREEYTRERFYYEAEYDRIFTGFGFQKAEKQKRIREFSGGEQVKLALIRLLLEKPDILVLDEPTNHLDFQTVEWLEQYLKGYEKAVVLVSHDRFFLDETATVIYDVEQKKLIRYVGSYTSYRLQKEKRQEQLQKEWERYAEEKERLDALIARFRGKPTKAAMVRAKKKQLERLMPAEKPVYRERKMFLNHMVPRKQSGKQVLAAKDLCFGYTTALTAPLSVKVRRGQKLAVIGENGAGKSTLLRVFAGQLDPLKGRVETGFQVQCGYFDQQVSAGRQEGSVLESFSGAFPSLTQKEIRSVLAAFLFTGRDVEKPVSVLSGGENVRLELAKLFYSCPNFLLLDEPTNHLDIRGKEAVEEMLLAYEGTLIVISHDRYFLDRVADALLIFEQGSVHYFPFGYRHYREQKKRLGVEILSHLERMDRMQKEQERLSDELKAVPKPERRRLRELPEEEAFLDWQLRLLQGDMDRIAEQLETLEDKLQQEMYQFAVYFEKEEEKAELERKKEELSGEWTRLCIQWYEISGQLQ